MDKNLSLRTNQQILALFSKIQEYQPATNRIVTFQKAIEIALQEEVDWAKHAKTTIRCLPDDTSAAGEFIQLRVDQQKWETIVEQVETSFTPRLSRTTIPYVVKLVLLNYAAYLESMKRASRSEGSSDTDAASEHEELELSDMAKVLFDMMLTDPDSDALKEIKKIMIDWEESSQ